jgi:hypothetical protein
MNDPIARLADEVAAGRMTIDEARRLAIDAALGIAPTSPQTPTPEPEVGVRYATDQAYALAALRRQGMTELEAFHALVQSPLSAFKDDIEAGRAADKAKAEAAAAAEQAASPKGRRQAAEQLQAEQAEQTKLAEQARLLLEAEGAPIDGLGPEELIEAAGLVEVERDTTADDLAANVAAIDGGEGTS